MEKRYGQRCNEPWKIDLIKYFYIMNKRRRRAIKYVGKQSPKRYTAEIEKNWRNIGDRYFYHPVKNNYIN